MQLIFSRHIPLRKSQIRQGDDVSEQSRIRVNANYEPFWLRKTFDL